MRRGLRVPKSGVDALGWYVSDVTPKRGVAKQRSAKDIINNTRERRDELFSKSQVFKVGLLHKMGRTEAFDGDPARPKCGDTLR